MLGSDGSEVQNPRSSRTQPQPQPSTQQPDSIICPRCESTNAKFCYYNNYKKTQPRYFCKACKRHWTKGGTLRDVPIGGGRKNKRPRRPNEAAIDTVAIRKNPSIDQDSLSLADDAKDSFFKPIDDVESYTDIEELKGLVSWDFYGSFVGCTMQQLAHGDHPRLGFSKLSSSFEVNPSSNISKSFVEKIEKGEDSSITTSMIMPSSQQWQVPSTSNFLELNNWKWNDLDTMVLEDLNKPWEDPEFKS